MPSARAELLHLRLPCDSAAPREARRALGQIREIAPVFEDAALIVSELTTNAILHSGAGPGDEIELRAELGIGVLVIEVIDEGRSDTTPHTRPPDNSSPGGFGLPVVAALARRWGTERSEGMRVWAELAL
ncbi:MAG: ATP-binding protein [Solirubrobacteraceae bacterium]